MKGYEKLRWWFSILRVGKRDRGRERERERSLKSVPKFRKLDQNIKRICIRTSPVIRILPMILTIHVTCHLHVVNICLKSTRKQNVNMRTGETENESEILRRGGKLRGWERVFVKIFIISIQIFGELGRGVKVKNLTQESRSKNRLRKLVRV